MEQLNGESCYRCFMAESLGESKQIRKDFSVAQTLMVTFFTCVLFKGHSGGNKVDPSLQDNVEILYNSVEYTYHFGSSHDCNSVF